MKIIIDLVVIIGFPALGIWLATISLPSKIKIIAWVFYVTLVVYAFYQKVIKKREKEKELANLKYDRNTWETIELFQRGLHQSYVNGLGENPKLAHHFNQAQELERQNKFLDAIEEHKKCLTHPDATISNKVASHIQIGNDYYSLSRFKDALEHYQMAQISSKSLEEKEEKMQAKGSVYGNIGLIYSELGKPKEALRYLEDALELHQKIGFEEGVAIQLGNIGLIYRILGQLQRALKYHEDALELHQKIRYELGIASDFGNIGLIYYDLKEPEKALKYLEDALELHRKIGNEEGVAAQLGNIGLIYRILGQLQKALKYHEDALSLHRKIGNEEGEANQLGNIGLIYHMLGNSQKALKHLEEALELHRKIGHDLGIAKGLGNIGFIYDVLGEPQMAPKYLEEALKIFNKIGAKREIERIDRNIGKIKGKIESKEGKDEK